MDTNNSLLELAKESAQSEAWFSLFNIYEPLIAGWISRSGVEESSVGDLTQEVLHVVATELPKFEHNGRKGAFRSWLKMISINRCRRFWDARKRQVESIQTDTAGRNVLDQLEDPESELSQQWEFEHDQFVLRRMLELTRKEFDDQSFMVFTRNAINGESAQAIARDIGISVGQIYKIKHRIMSRLRELAEGIIDDIQFKPE